MKSLLFTLLALATGQAQFAPINDEPLTLPAIVYPADARSARTEGAVKLQIDVDAAGRVTSVTALAGPTLLRQAAVDAYRQATYPPLIANGRPTPAIITTTVNFSLKELPPDTDLLTDRQFEPLHGNCRQLSLTYPQDRSPETLDTCRQAVALAGRFSPQAQLEARAAALNDLVLLLIVDGKSPPPSPKQASTPTRPSASSLAPEPHSPTPPP